MATPAVTVAVLTPEGENVLAPVQLSHILMIAATVLPLFMALLGPLFCVTLKTPRESSKASSSILFESGEPGFSMLEMRAPEAVTSAV